MAFAAVACLLVVAFLAIMPPSMGAVPQLTDADGDVLPRSVAEKTWVDVDGARIGMVIEGQDASNPVLLVLGGGPGIPEYWMEYEWPSGLDQHFAVCWMDWRGAGLSFDANLDPSTCTTERYVRGVIAVTDYLRGRFGQDRVYLMGHSFGAYMALQVLRDHSELYTASVGMSQITSVSREKAGYERMLELCQQAGNRDLQDSLERYRSAIDAPDGALDMGDPWCGATYPACATAPCMAWAWARSTNPPSPCAPPCLSRNNGGGKKILSTAWRSGKCGKLTFALMGQREFSLSGVEKQSGSSTVPKTPLPISVWWDTMMTKDDRRVQGRFMPNYNSAVQMRNQSASSTSQKQIPQNIEAEQSVLAACMLNRNAIDEVATKLTPDSFFRPAHQLIFAGMMDLHTRNLPIDQISLAENLRASGQLEAAGGRAYLVELADNTFALTNWLTHTDIVKRTSVLRELIYASAQITALAYDAPDDLDEVVEDAEKTLFRVTEQRVSSSFAPINKLLYDAFEEISKLAEQKSHMAGVPTGFADVDNLFHGLRGGDLIILAARPGVGKTSFALNMAVNAAKAGYPTTFFSLEMSASQLVQRILCSEAHIGLEKVRGGFLGEADWQALADAMARLSNIELYIDDTPSLSILEARAKARRELHGKENGLIVVDYLQLMQPPQTRKDGNRAVEVGEISRGLKVLAKEMNMPVIALSQLSRAIEMRGHKKRPMLSDLRESGSIEQDADIVMFIDRSMDDMEAESDDRPDKGTANLIVAKHRNGPTRDITLSWSAESTMFGDYFDDSRYEGAI